MAAVSAATAVAAVSAADTDAAISAAAAVAAVAAASARASAAALARAAARRALFEGASPRSADQARAGTFSPNMRAAFELYSRCAFPRREMQARGRRANFLDAMTKVGPGVGPWRSRRPAEETQDSRSRSRCRRRRKSWGRCRCRGSSWRSRGPLWSAEAVAARPGVGSTRSVPLGAGCADSVQSVDSRLRRCLQAE